MNQTTNDQTVDSMARELMLKTRSEVIASSDSTDEGLLVTLVNSDPSLNDLYVQQAAEFYPEWSDIIHTIHDFNKRVGDPSYTVSQIKDKFGTLRFYVYFDDEFIESASDDVREAYDYAREFCSMAERMSTLFTLTYINAFKQAVDLTTQYDAQVDSGADEKEINIKVKYVEKQWDNEDEDIERKLSSVSISAPNLSVDEMENFADTLAQSDKFWTTFGWSVIHSMAAGGSPMEIKD